MTDWRALERDRRRRRREAMLSACLPQQRAAILDPAQLKALFCTRRAGKSWSIGLYLFLTALAHPESSCLYLGLTKATATGIMVKDVFRVIDKTFDIGAVWKESHSRWELPNGSYIYLRGADANAYEISKVVGQKYRLAVLDEASKYRYVVRDMVYSSLLPAMGDDVGTIVLSGTPSNIIQGLFYDVTTGAEPGWKTHTWSWRDNVHKAQNIKRTHDELVASNPEIVKTPGYRQEWLGEWVIDDSARVYKFREDVNTADGLPWAAGDCLWILGVDLGYNDPTAFAVCAYHPNDPTLYVVEVQKKPGLTFDDVATIIRDIARRYPILSMVVDAADLQGVETMRQRHGLPLMAAEKHGKRGVIEAMNSDIITGRVKLLPGASELSDEWNALVWDDRELQKVPRKWVEDPRLQNHACDAALYAWRRARNYDAQPAPTPKPSPLSKEAADAEYERLLRGERRGPRLEVDRGPAAWTRR